MNNFNCVGVCVKDPEFRQTKSGTSMLIFKIANDVGFGEKKKTNWVDVFIFGKIAEGWLKDTIKKGVKVIVNGALVNEINEKDGKTYSRLSLNVRDYDSIHVISEKKSEKKEQDNFNDFDDSIPF